MIPLCVLFCALTLSATAATNQPLETTFIVKKKEIAPKKSRNELKEHLGGAIKETLSACTQLTKEIAALQGKVATIQEQLLAKGEQLLENRHPFKKATAEELRAAIDAVEQSIQRLAQLKQSITHTDVQKVPTLYEQTVCMKDSAASNA